jgi:HlyD family secretion protein
VESDVKKVQHPSGGVVKTLDVGEGARVKAGALLVHLDETVAQANLVAITKSLWELKARRARLQAERDGKNDFAFDDDLAARDDPSATSIMQGERAFFDIRRAANDGQKKQLGEQISQLKEQIGGMTEQLAAKKQEAALIDKELVGVRQLWDQRLVSLPRLTTLQRESARLLGERGQLTASIAQARGRIAETELKILQIDQDFRSGVAKELADIRAKYAETVEKHVTARDQLNRLDIRSPQAGVVHDLIVHTAGAVITPGETIMTIVPDNDVLQIETRVQPKDIDQIHIGSSAMLRFTSFDARTTPEIDGTVRRIGADVSHDDNSTEPYFVVRLDVDPEQQEKLGKARLIPGMPVEVFIRTSARSMLSYLMKPLADQARRAFREK